MLCAKFIIEGIKLFVKLCPQKQLQGVKIICRKAKQTRYYEDTNSSSFLRFKGWQ